MDPEALNQSQMADLTESLQSLLDAVRRDEITAAPATVRLLVDAVATLQTVARPPSNLPLPDVTKPLFTYGALQPGEIAHPLIELKVRRREQATLHGARLLVRDGLPFIEDDATGAEYVEGWLLDLDLAGYEAVCSFEPKRLYKWRPSLASVTPSESSNGNQEANVLLGRSEQRGNPDLAGVAWHSRDDPVLSVAPAVALDMYEAIDESQLFPNHLRTPAYWEQLFHLQAAYLLLWTVYERLTALRYGPALDPVARIHQLQVDPKFMSAFQNAGCKGGYAVYDSRNLSKVTVGPNGEKALEAWYLARSNLSHRGKGAHGDPGTLAAAFVDAHSVLGRLLPTLVEGW